jgi:HprK-related kinase B
MTPVGPPSKLVAHFATPFGLDVRFADVSIRIDTSDADLAARLRDYYAPWIVDDAHAPCARVRVIQGTVAVDGEFVEIKRGGRRVKEAVQEVLGGRLIRKTQTGVLMGLERGRAFAVGDVGRYLNQAINLVNTCYAKEVLARGHLLLHASAVARAGRAAVLAGPPGAGKSTAALHLLEHGLRFVSNDRVLARPVGDAVEILGYPKQPRVNPGTLLGHPRLVELVPAGERRELAAMPLADLWQLERKSDVDLETLYGRGTCALDARMAALVLLRWRPGAGAFRARSRRLAGALGAIPLLHKDLGVFDLDLPALEARPRPDPRAYAELFSRVPVVEVSGGVDHSALREVVDTTLGR